MGNMIFRSRIGVLITAFVFLILIYTYISTYQQMRYKVSFIIVGCIVIAILTFGGTRYIISGNKLYVRIMWFIPQGSVNISDIVSLKRSYNINSSPAISLKRLRVDYKSGSNYHSSFMLISPVREQEFIQELKTINPNIDVSVPDKKGIWRILDWDI
jgi:hypothetical protein